MSGKNASSLWINLKPNQFISSAGYFILFYITIEIIFYQLEVWHKTSIYSWKSTFTSLLFYFLCRKYENQNQGIFILYIQERNPLFPVQVWCKIIILVNNESFIFYIRWKIRLTSTQNKKGNNNNQINLITFYQVDIETTKCNNNPYSQPYCVCGMAVRVGKDLFVINRCADIDIGFRFCDEGLIDVRKHGEFIYKVELIFFRSGKSVI